MSTPVSRLANYANDSAAKVPISSTEVDSEMNQWVSALNRKVVTKATAPSSPVQGDTWYDSTNDKIKAYNGSAWIELPTIASPSNGQTIQYDGTNWIAVNASSGNAVELTDRISVATSTIARSSNVVTIVTGSAHGLVNGDVVDIAGITGDTTMNTVGATITKVNNTTFTYPSTGSDKGTTSDTGGTVRTSIETDASAGAIFYMTLAANRYLRNPTNLTNWQKVIFIFKQDGTGSRTITLGSDFRLDANLGTTLPIVLAAGKSTYVGAIYNGNDSKLDILAVSGSIG